MHVKALSRSNANRCKQATRLFVNVAQAVYQHDCYAHWQTVFGNFKSNTYLYLYLIVLFWYASVAYQARPNEPDMPPKRTKKVRLGIYRAQIQPKIR